MTSNTNSVTAQQLLDAVEGAEQLWPHNAHAVEDTPVEMAVLVALGKPTGAPPAARLLRRSGNHPEPVRRLFDGVFGKALEWSSFDLFAAPCDRCLRDVQPKHSLWVLAGATVVDLHCCTSCRNELDTSLSDLVQS